MSGQYARCRYEKERCEMMVLNVSGLCMEHRKRKCLKRNCKVMITGRQKGKYCEKHMEAAARQAAGSTWEGV